MTTETTLRCPSCGAAAVPGDRFCEACGADLPDPEAAVEQQQGPACPSCGAEAAAVADGYCGVCGMRQPATADHVEAGGAGAGAVSDRGKRHHRNEDAFALHVDEGGGRVLAVVCDGVSTTVDPDEASRAAADAALAALLDGGDLTAAHAAAQQAVLAVSTEEPPPELGWPSSTFLAAVVRDPAVELATLGDCRTFWLPASGTPSTLTEDDSWAAEQIAAGEMSPEEAYADPRAHTITRWLGRDADPAWSPRLASFRAEGPGRLVLCSDGLWNDAPSAEAVAAAGDPADGDALALARRLTDFANRSGGHDNITVVVVDLKGPPS
ncbi:MAG TPA: protein phosphatase 2C domain-containing protein [Acidimicrobiales bacterium]|nr:protein phosphatase 2C domain-containing protein [Acidimicrobiales bacterium]